MTNQWSVAKNISNGKDAYFPNVTAHSGRVDAAWSEIESGNTKNQHIIAATSADGGLNWQTPIGIGPVNGTSAGASPLQVAAAPDGSIYWLWQDYAPSKIRTLWLRKRNPDGSMSVGRNITNFDTNGGAISVDGGGTLHIAYYNIHIPAKDAQIEYITSTDGGVSFSAPVMLNGRNTYGDHIALVIDSGGRVHVIYEQTVGTVYSIFARRLENGNWTTAVAIYNARSYNQQASVRDDGGVGVVIQANSAGQGQIRYATWSEAAGWTTSEVVGGSHAEYPALAYDHTDLPHIVYTDGAGNNTHIYYVTGLAGGGFSAPIALSGNGRASVSKIAFAGGMLHLVYQYDPSGNLWQIYYAATSI